MKREKDIVRIVSDPEGHQRRVRDMTEIHRVGDDAELLERWTDAVQAMRRTRAELAAELATVNPVLAFKGDRWSIMHVLWHLGARDGHMEPAREIVERGATEVKAIPKREDRLADGIEMTLGEMDEALSFAERLTVRQLAMTALRVHRRVSVIGIVEGTAEHFIDHLGQIRELKRELGMPVAAAEPAAGVVQR